MPGNPFAEANQPKPVEHESAATWLEHNVLDPAINSGPLGIYNTVAECTGMKPENLAVDKATPYSTEWFTQNLFSGVGAAVPFLLASAGAGKLMGATDNLLASTSAGKFLNPVLTSKTAATIIGGTAYSALQKPQDGHTRIGDALGTGIGLGVFGAGNSVLKEMSLTSKLVGYPAVGFIGGASMNGFSNLFSTGNFGRTEDAIQSGVAGMTLNSVFGGVGELANKRAEASKNSDATKTNDATKISDALKDRDILPPVDGKVADITGPGITDKWGVTATDLGVSIVAPNGKLISVFGDTFSGNRVGEGDWRSPVALVGTGDANHLIQYEYAGGANPNYAEQLIPYVHDNPNSGWTHGGISTIIPSDLLRVGQRLYLHGIENHGFGNVTKTGIWSSDDSGVSWKPVAQFAGDAHNGYAQCWSWDYNPDDGFAYVISTGFQRDKGIILRRVKPEDIGDDSKYSGWGWANNQWGWNNEPTPITPPGEQWGELSLRRMGQNKWVLGGFLSSEYALGYRVIDSPTADLTKAPLQKPVVGVPWGNEDPARNQYAQLYGGFQLQGSQLDTPGGFGIIVSQWNTDTNNATLQQGCPYRAMQVKATLKDTTAGAHQASFIQDTTAGAQQTSFKSTGLNMATYVPPLTAANLRRYQGPPA